MAFVTQGKTNWKFLLIILILSILAGAGIFYWQSKLGKNIFEPQEITKNSNDSGLNLCSSETDWQAFKNVQVELKENQTDSSKTDVFIKNLDTGEEKLYVTLADVYTQHYHGSEFNNGNLYIIRRIGDPSLGAHFEGSTYVSNPNWTDELWKYSCGRGGVMLFSLKGLDFRVSPDGQYAAVSDNDKLFFVNTENGAAAKQYSSESLSMYSQEVGETGTLESIDLEGWADNSEHFWFAGAFTDYPATLVEINTADWTFNKFDVSKLPLQFQELSINYNTGKIAYSDHPAFFDAYSSEEWNAGNNLVTLFIYDLNSGENKTIATTTNKNFYPVWLDNNDLQYSNPNGSGSVVYSLINN